MKSQFSISVGCQQISKLQMLRGIVFVISEVVANNAMCPAIKYAGLVETLVVAAVVIVAVIAVMMNSKTTFRHSDDAQSWVAGRGGQSNKLKTHTSSLQSPPVHVCRGLKTQEQRPALGVIVHAMLDNRIGCGDRSRWSVELAR